MSGPRCGAKCRDGHACTMRPMVGQTRCMMHGGKTPSHLRAGARRLAEQEAVKSIRKVGIVEPVADPVEVLRELATEALDLKSYFADRLKALEQLRYQSGAGEQLRAEVSLYERALDRSHRFLHDLARLGLNERSVRVDEARVVLLGGWCELEVVGGA